MTLGPEPHAAFSEGRGIGLAGFWRSFPVQSSVRVSGLWVRSLHQRGLGGGARRAKDDTRPPVSSLPAPARLPLRPFPLDKGWGTSMAGQGIRASGPMSTNAPVRAAIWILENEDGD